MSFEIPRANNIESRPRPEKLYRAFTVNPESLSLQTLKSVLIPGSVHAEDPTKIGDGNELGVYMSTNPNMVESAYAHSGVTINVPRYHDKFGLTNQIKLPSCGIVVEVETTNLAIRPPQIIGALRGHYNNGFLGDEWIADSVPSNAYRVTKLILSKHSNDTEKVIVDVQGLDDTQLSEAITLIKEKFEEKRQEALKFKEFLESLTEKERFNEYLVKKKYEEYERQK